jgi:hypothetical protein
MSQCNASGLSSMNDFTHKPCLSTSRIMLKFWKKMHEHNPTMECEGYIALYEALIEVLTPKPALDN